MESDVSFYRRRAVEEQIAARRATCPAARDRHEEMADMYRLRLETLKPAAAEDVGAITNESARLMSEDVDPGRSIETGYEREPSLKLELLTHRRDDGPPI